MSSGFKENFERGEKDNLDYDDSAFYYFGLALLLIALIPATWYMIIKPILFGEFSINHSLKNCKCFICIARMKKRAKKYKYSWFNSWFVMKFVVIAIGWAMCYQCFEAVKGIEPLKNFVPHELLGVATDASVSQVKKAYRKLSREKHPDKNPDNPEAVNEFIQITKAYTIMTDEKARDNFLKYGNPDGKGSMAVGIALPNFLQKKEYQLHVLIAFFILITFVIPAIFWNRINSNARDVGGVAVENRKVFTELINENMLGKQIPGMFAQTVEFSAMKVRSKDELAILSRIKMNDNVKEAIPKQKGDRPPVQVKPICLLMGYMYGLLKDEDEDLEGIRDDLECILRSIPSYMDIMLSQTMMLSQAFKMGQSPKRITAKNIMTLIQFSQNLMQGGWQSKDPFTQLPFIENENVGKFKHQIGGITLFNYCMKTKEERKAAVENVYKDAGNTAEVYREQEHCIDALPLVKLTMTAFVEGEDEIVVGDILTCKMRVDYYNMEKGQKSGYVHSKFYPYLKKDNWFLIITDDTFTNLAAVEKLEVRDNFFEKEFKERISRPGKISFTAILTNDSFKGLDQFAKVEVNVVAEAKNRVIRDYAKEDIKAIKEQNMLAAALMEEDETDEDEADDVDENIELMNKLKAAGLEQAVYGKQQKPKADVKADAASMD